jgi:hypothetical protein
MDNDCIIFLHHKTCDVTLNNLKQMKYHNPNKKLYTVGFDGFELIENSHIVDKNSVVYPNNDMMISNNKDWLYWSEADLLIYNFYINYPNYARYIITEWDVYCNCSAEEFYGDLYYEDILAHGVVNDTNIKDWSWYYFLNDQQRNIPNLGGIGPVLIVFSNKALNDITNLATKNPRYYDNMFSELRMGTLASHCGYVPKQFMTNDTFVSWKYEFIKFDANVRGWYHPIKTLV